jgi:hypothetical protein
LNSRFTNFLPGKSLWFDDEYFLKTIIPSRKFYEDLSRRRCMTDVKLSKEEIKLLKAIEAGEFADCPDNGTRHMIHDLQ